LFLVVGPIWVRADAAAHVLLDLALVDDPFQGAAVAKVDWNVFGGMSDQTEALPHEPAPC
jgi:hypothetical protein